MINESDMYQVATKSTTKNEVKRNGYIFFENMNKFSRDIVASVAMAIYGFIYFPSMLSIIVTALGTLFVDGLNIPSKLMVILYNFSDVYTSIVIVCSVFELLFWRKSKKGKVTKVHAIALFMVNVVTVYFVNILITNPGTDIMLMTASGTLGFIDLCKAMVLPFIVSVVGGAILHNISKDYDSNKCKFSLKPFKAVYKEIQNRK